MNGCNNAITAQKFGIENRKLNIGDNIIEFAPDKEGNFIYSCWMGMISSNIKVVEDVTSVYDKGINNIDDSNPKGTSGAGGCCKQ